MKRHSRLSVVAVIAVLSLFAMSCSMGRKSETKPAETSGSAPSASNASTATSAPAAPVANIAGKYNVTGTNPDGNVYKGTLEVIAHGDVYQFRWNAGEQYDGVGITNGDVAAAAFTGGANGEGCGVVDYVIQSDGNLDGKWGYWGVNESGTERATRTSGSGLEGEYDATGKNPSGKEYKARISVEEVGNLYKFVWTNGSEGIGIKQGSNIAVGIGGNRCGFVSYQIKSDGTLDGLWGGYGTERTGTEKAVKQ
ncbi:MAG TPA: hypothetical protein VJT71_01455 [Pyrinomonadaceae bacterium]|nr:hypothetical protein [Pyrinomonadaceae bacterium]